MITDDSANSASSHESRCFVHSAGAGAACPIALATIISILVKMAVELFGQLKVLWFFVV